MLFFGSKKLRTLLGNLCSHKSQNDQAKMPKPLSDTPSIQCKLDQRQKIAEKA